MSPRILVVEDEVAIRDAITYSLSTAGHDVIETGLGEAGLEAALGEPFDAIVLDLLLPDINGADLCARFRQHDHSTPVVMMTARNDKEAERIAREAGVTAFVTKPFSLPDLLEQLQSLLKQNRRREDHPSPA